MNPERRQHPRRRFREDVPGCFYLLHGEERFELDAAYDVSVSGMGVGLPRPLPEGARVRVGYVEPGFQLELEASVAWCDASHSPCRLGLRFSPDPMQANDNALFFMTLREYLDDFGESS